MNRPTSPEDVQKVFDCYCKKILKNEAINIQKHYQHLNDVQVSFQNSRQNSLRSLPLMMIIPRTMTFTKSWATT